MLTFYPLLIRGDGGTLDSNIILLDSLSTLHSHWKGERLTSTLLHIHTHTPLTFIIRLIPVLYAKVIAVYV